jgi:hypothetical protein
VIMRLTRPLVETAVDMRKAFKNPAVDGIRVFLVPPYLHFSPIRRHSCERYSEQEIFFLKRSRPKSKIITS